MSDTGAKIIHGMIAWKEYEVEGFKLVSINLPAFLGFHNPNLLDFFCYLSFCSLITVILMYILI